MLWIICSLTAAVFFALRYIILKKYLSNADTMVIAFTTRLLGVVFLLPLLFFFDLKNFSSPLLWKAVVVTSILTAAASILQLHAVKHYDVSASVPFLSFVPFFMLVSVFFIFQEVPKPASIIGLVLLSAGGMIVSMQQHSGVRDVFAGLIRNRGGLLFLCVAVIFGLTTTLDRVGIDSSGSGGFTYTFCWFIFSTALFGLIFFNVGKIPFYLGEMKKYRKGFFMQGLAGIIAFLMQMLAVELAKGVEANVIYVKALTMLQLFITVILGIVFLNEKNARNRIIGSALMLLGAIEIVMFVV